jgi:hypothetical protein
MTEVAQKHGLLLIIYVFIWTKNGLGDILGDILGDLFTNSSGHPAALELRATYASTQFL